MTMKAIYDILKNKELFSFQLQYAETDFLFSSDSKSEVEFLKDFFSSSCCFDQLASSYVWKIYSVQFAVPSELKQSFLKNSYVEDYWDNQQIRVSKHTKSQYVFQLDFNNDNFTFLDLEQKVIFFIKPRVDDMYNEHLIHILREALKYESKAKGYIDIHGAALSYQDKNLLIVGPKGCGKTTLLTYFLKKKATYVSNDSARLSMTGNVPILYAWPHYLRLGKDTVYSDELLQQYIRTRNIPIGKDDKFLLTTKDICEAYDISNIKCCSLDYILIPKIQIGSENFQVERADVGEDSIANLFQDTKRVGLIPCENYDHFNHISNKTLNIFLNTSPKCLRVVYGTKSEDHLVDMIMSACMNL